MGRVIPLFDVVAQGHEGRAVERAGQRHGRNPGTQAGQDVTA